MSDGKTASSSYSQQNQNSGSLYSFSVHQPYTNWPLHASHTTPYAPSWYTLPTQQYSVQKTYCEREIQTLQPGEDPTLGHTSSGEQLDLGELELKFAKHWHAALSAFLKRAGLLQALAGLREDMQLLNEDWEKEQFPGALQSLVKDISECTESGDSTLPKKSLEERKLEHTQFQNGIESQSPSSTIKSISRLLKQSRRRNDASNRAEFLQSAAEKRRRLNGLDDALLTSEANSEIPNKESSTGSMDIDTTLVSCARADAKAQDRDFQMKYDIAKNEDGPLKRTMKREQSSSGSSVKPTQSLLPLDRNGSRDPTAEKYPGIAARMESIEDHLAVRFVPSLPRSLLDRLKFLEDYIVRLEKDYPPWAALHFNQPNRGWPPPPRLAPIIVPTHLATPESTMRADSSSTATASVQGRSAGSTITTVPGQTSSSKSGGGAKGKATQSSLHRAIMEKLEIQRAMGDLAGSGTLSIGDSAQR